MLASKSAAVRGKRVRVPAEDPGVEQGISEVADARRHLQHDWPCRHDRQDGHDHNNDPARDSTHQGLVSVTLWLLRPGF